jgi:5-methylcytosine-specific restriction enzyme A
MANKSPKYCASFPCSNLAEPGSSYCLEHRPAKAPKDTDPFYLSVGWRRFRAWYLSRHPLCETCELEGRGAVPAAMVDHIVEIQDGGDRLAEQNAMALCWKCHGIKTANEKNHRRSTRNNRSVSTTDTYIQVGRR